MVRRVGAVASGPTPRNTAVVARANTPEPVSCQLAGSSRRGASVKNWLAGEARTAVPEPTVLPAGWARSGSLGRWVLLAYRLPREPSNPRVGVWRKLERLGVARLGDGLVALPADARTREQLDWLAEEIAEA